MSQEEQDATLGRLIREINDETCHLACLEKKRSEAVSKLERVVYILNGKDRDCAIFKDALPVMS